jgi:RNA polymerase sigma-70 factor (ECF subfamily)
MADENSEWQSWVRRLACGDDEVVNEFWGQYGDRLQGLAAKFLTSKLYRREGPEDVVQSVCRTFLRRAKEGQFELADRDSLWRLLCAITVAKVREKARYHGRQRRSFERERPLDGSRVGAVPVEAFEPTPAEAAEFADELRGLLDEMDEEEREVVLLRIEEYTYPEIAERLGRSKRTVRRILKRVQSRLQRMLEES